ncbi:MAG: 6-phosphogluconolactonase [Clostridiales Family XIII bacterium]|jgi:glucosamine-6-phosphate deaminase|nr:6-phosphogluconolactonase [Clostridiales Family XIII bacterium]
MNIKTYKTEKEFDTAVAWEMVAQIVKKPNSVIGLATGNTTENIHHTVANIWRDYPFDISQVIFYAADEVEMVPPDSRVSCIFDLNEALFIPCNIPREHIVIPATIADDYDREAAEFDRRLKGIGESDMQILGIGPDGHIAMNLPHGAFDSPTRFTALSGELHQRILNEGQFPADKELGGITIGIKPIMNMPRVLLAAKGERKAAIIKAAVTGPVTEETPASILQLHPNVDVFLDEAAASQL